MEAPDLDGDTSWVQKPSHDLGVLDEDRKGSVVHIPRGWGVGRAIERNRKEVRWRSRTPVENVREMSRKHVVGDDKASRQDAETNGSPSGMPVGMGGMVRGPEEEKEGCFNAMSASTVWNPLNGTEAGAIFRCEDAEEIVNDMLSMWGSVWTKLGDCSNGNAPSYGIAWGPACWGGAGRQGRLGLKIRAEEKIQGCRVRRPNCRTTFTRANSMWHCVDGWYLGYLGV